MGWRSKKFSKIQAVYDRVANRTVTCANAIVVGLILWNHITKQAESCLCLSQHLASPFSVVKELKVLLLVERVIPSVTAACGVCNSADPYFLSGDFVFQRVAVAVTTRECLSSHDAVDKTFAAKLVVGSYPMDDNRYTATKRMTTISLTLESGGHITRWASPPCSNSADAIVLPQVCETKVSSKNSFLLNV